MPRIKVNVATRVARSPRIAAAIIALGMALLFPQPSGRARAEPADALLFRTNIFLNGDYVVRGVNLRTTGVGGFATGSISVTDVPENAAAVSALLYWQTVLTQNSNPVPSGAMFRGNDISTIARDLVPSGTSPCWSGGGGTGGSGGSHRTHTYLADVLRFLPVVNGKFQANGTHSVRLPDSGSGNAVPSTAGASLVVIYRDAAKPLTSIVVYDGSYSMDNATESMTQTIQGFYQASLTSPVAKLTHIVGDGSAGKSDRLRFGTPGSSTFEELNAFQGTSATAGASDPAWDNITRDVSDFVVPGASSAVTMVDHDSFTPFDCLSWGALVFSTTVQDTDHDGLVDAWESSGTSGSLSDPAGQLLPNLYAMGARPDHQDFFAEVGYTWSNGWDAATTGQVPTPGLHDHQPGPAVWKMIGDALKNAPTSNPDGTTGIRFHVDAGPTYQAVDGTVDATEYVMPAILARGGEKAEEKACIADTANPPRWTCQFPRFPGTVIWKFGLQAFMYSPVAANGQELTTAQEEACFGSGGCRTRFDAIRKDMFHYLLYAHATGEPKASCLNPNGTPNFDCAQTNEDFHVPTSRSGYGDEPGGDALITFGLWPNVSNFLIASTTAHEIGHNIWRGHRGGNPAAASEPLEANCNPNYLSVMNYFFQKGGVQGADGIPTIDFSREQLPSLNENNLRENVSLGSTRYRSAWYAPRAGVAQALATTAAKRHCDGSTLSAAEEADRLAGGGMVRIDAFSNVTPPIDWNGDLSPTAGPISQDVTFNGVINNANSDSSKLLVGSSDWPVIADLGLQQLGSRINSLGSLGLLVGGGGGLLVGGGGGLLVGGGGGVMFGGGAGLLVGGGGGLVFGGGGLLVGGGGGLLVGGGGGLELDLDGATSVGNPPHSFKAEVVPGRQPSVNLSWKPATVPNAGGVQSYQIYRVDGAGVTAASFAKRRLIAQPDGTTTTTVDNKVTGGSTYTWFATVHYGDGTVSGISNLATRTIPR
jgi:hypothetical protein